MKSLSCLLLAVVACGGGGAEGPKGPAGPGGGSAAPLPAGDVSFELPAIEVKGIAFEPEALGRPGMPLYDPKKKTTVEKQRALFLSTKDPVQKEAQAAILATLLYEKAKDDKANEKALWTEARQTLRDAAQISGAKVDEVTLRLLGSYELLFDDYPAAEKAWSQLVAVAPKDKDVQYNRAWWVYSLLQQGKNREALDAVGKDKLDEKQPELAYAAAWAHWRTGDATGAWQAIAVAAKGWGSSANREAVERDLFVFVSRASVSMEEALPTMLSVFGKDQEYEALVKLGGTAYRFAGRWKDSLAALERAVQVGGAKLTPGDKVVIRYSETDIAVSADMPEVAAQHGKETIEALPACGAKCSDKDKQNAVLGIYYTGRLYHSLYATAHDPEFYQPAHDLYAVTIPMLTDLSLKTQATREAAALESDHKNLKVGTGTHDKGFIGSLLSHHNQEAQACYEAALASNSKLGGTVVLTLDSDATGVIKGAATEPKAGLEGVSAVAGCIAERAKAWKLPKRGMPGTTRIKLSYTLSPRK